MMNILQPTPCVGTPTPDTSASVPQGSLAMATSHVRPPRSGPCARPTLTAPTTRSARPASASADRASPPPAPSASMLMSVGQIPRCAAPMPCVSTLPAPSPAPVCPPLLAHPLPPPALSRVRVSSAHSTPSARLRTRRPTVSASLAGPMTPPTLLPAVLM